MVSFNILSQNRKGVRYRLGVFEVPECYFSTYDGNKSVDSSVETTSKTPYMDKNINETGTGTDSSPGWPRSSGPANIATPSFSIPTLGGFPQFILPKVELDQGESCEITSLIPELDYLLVGHGLELERVRRRRMSAKVERERGYGDSRAEEDYEERSVGNASRFDLLRHPTTQLASKDYIRYLMFRQPLISGASCWNGTNGILVQAECGRVNVGVEDMLASVEHFRPAFFISPAEEAQTGHYGKKVSFRSIQKADEILLSLLHRLGRSPSPALAGGNAVDTESSRATTGGGDSAKRASAPTTRLLANIQGAQFLEYRLAAALGVWDMCRGTGKGLGNVKFTSDGSAELKSEAPGGSGAATCFDELILGVAIGGLGYSENLSKRSECIKAVVDHIPDDKLRFMSLDVGSPIEILQAVYLGVDIIECPYVYKCSLGGAALSFNLDEFMRQAEIVSYSKEEKINAEKFLLELDFSSSSYGAEEVNNSKETEISFGGAKYIDLNDRGYSCDSGKLTENSPVPHSRAYIHHLINSGEILGVSLLFMHNYWQYQNLLLLVRRAILDGRLEDFATWFIYTQTDIHIHPTKLPEPTLETYTFDGMKGKLQKDLVHEN
ncbi:queuine tRNA-guanine transglycosylase [Cryptosporidium canis]|uniref:Queuine tRNA-guanine transglycosylase n=1 Tax=Cryptosporidium canis TaxID=195482 RepID=A0A9D5HYQ8_9CRYT|nr:queuine tRNA-guanine transglycosylase [Cryptosporidium canis]